MNTVDAIQTVANATANVTSLINKGLKLKLFLIVGICTFVLGLGLGLTAGVYWGYKKWTHKVDKLMEQSKQYQPTLEKLKEKVKEKL